MSSLSVKVYSHRHVLSNSFAFKSSYFHSGMPSLPCRTTSRVPEGTTTSTLPLSVTPSASSSALFSSLTLQHSRSAVLSFQKQLLLSRQSTPVFETFTSFMRTFAQFASEKRRRSSRAAPLVLASSSVEPNGQSASSLKLPLTSSDSISASGNSSRSKDPSLNRPRRSFCEMTLQSGPSAG